MSLLGHERRHGETYLIRASMHVTAQDECKHGWHQNGLERHTNGQLFAGLQGKRTLLAESGGVLIVLRNEFRVCWHLGLRAEGAGGSVGVEKGVDIVCMSILWGFLCKAVRAWSREKVTSDKGGCMAQDCVTD